MWGFRVKYKTEICRNWEMFGFCEFSESVRLVYHFMSFNSARLHMVIMSFRESSTCLRTIKQSFANSTMSIYIALMELDANFFMMIQNRKIIRK